MGTERGAMLIEIWVGLIAINRYLFEAVKP